MIETRTSFARRMGRHKSWVTRLAKAGRLVLTDDGRMVEVEASLKRLQATTGTRFDVADRWESERRSSNGKPDQREPEPELDADDIGKRTRLAQMRKEEAEATKRQMEVSELKGDLVRRGDIERAIADAVAVILSAIEVMPDRIAPSVHGLTDMERIRARVKDEMDGLCRRVSVELGRAAEGSADGRG